VRRREVTAALLLSAVAPFGSALAQPGLAIPTVGVLIWGSPGQDPYVEPLLQGLHELGYADGRNIALDIRYAGADSERGRTAMAGLARANPAVIVASTTPSAHFAKEATSTIPIVMAPVSDPVATGLVANLARPGGNMTGVSGLTTEALTKGLEALRQITPELSRVAFLGSTRDPNAHTFLRALQPVAAGFGIYVDAIWVATSGEFESAFDTMRAANAQALLVQPIFANEAPIIAGLALRHSLPTASSVFGSRGGLLIGYGAAPGKLMRQAAAQIDKILKGAKPADIPVEQSTHFDFVLNLKVARTLGLTIPPALLARADEVIE
jgi:putative ABC transport system substrate-binding protein